MKLSSWAGLCAAALLLSACGASKNVVIAPPESNNHFSSIRIVEQNSTVKVEENDTHYFREKLTEYLGDEFQQSNDDSLVLSYSFIGFDRGNRLKRYLSGGVGNWGEGGLVIQTTFRDPEGNELAKINTDASIDGGVFGGDIQSAFKKAAQKIAEFTTNNFSE